MTPRPALVAAALLGLVVALLGLAPPWEAFGLAALLAASMALMHRAIGLLDLRHITFPAFWYLTYLAAVVVPGLVVAADRDHPNEPTFLFAMLSVLVTAPAGMLLANAAARFARAETGAFFARALPATAPGLHYRVVFWSAIGGTLLMVGQYLREVPSIPLFYLIRHPGSLAEVTLLREESFKLLESRFLYFYEVLRKVGFPVLVAVSLGQYLQTRAREWWRAFLFVSVLGIFFASLSVAKAPVALIALIGCFTWYLHRGGRLSVRAVVLGALLVLCFPLAVLLALSTRAEVTVWTLLVAIMRRLFVLPAEILYSYFEIFPARLDFLHGRTIGRVAWLLGEPSFSLSSYAYQYIFPGGIDSGSAPAAFIGYFYADFGLAGVVLGGLLTGVIIQSVHIYLVRRPKTVLSLASYAFMYWAFWQANLAALPQTVLSGGCFFVLGGMVLFEAAERFLDRAVRTVPAAGVRAGGR